jgi:hypothetical protein
MGLKLTRPELAEHLGVKDTLERKTETELYYVLDQSVMRKPILKNLVQSGHAVSFIVPDTALVEMVKDERWEDTMRGSFAALVSVLDRTFVSLSVGEAIRIELATLKPVDRASLLPQEFATCVRQLIRALTSADASNALDEIRARITAFRSELLAKEVNAVAEKNSVEQLVARLEAACGQRTAKDMRAGRMSREAQLGLIREQANVMLIRDFGIEPENASAFGRSKPLVLRYTYLRLWHVMWWAKHRGLQAASPPKVLNHRLDQEYVLIGSFFDAILTLDSVAKEADEDLRRLLNDNHREELEGELHRYLQGI